MKKTIRIPWVEFLGYAMDTVESKYPGATNPVLRKTTSYEGDMDCYDLPEFVEIEIV
jgi:hypothetical protein